MPDKPDSKPPTNAEFSEWLKEVEGADPKAASQQRQATKVVWRDLEPDADTSRAQMAIGQPRPLRAL